GPEIHVQLVSDTGVSHSDRITSDPGVTGYVRDSSGVASFEIRLNDGPWTNGLPLVENGFFTLSAAELAALEGGELADGRHTLQLRATDGNDTPSPVAQFTFTLDTLAPAVFAPSLAAGSDTGLSRVDRITSD